MLCFLPYRQKRSQLCEEIYSWFNFLENGCLDDIHVSIYVDIEQFS